MYPILYDMDETSFTSNGLGRLRDCISCVVTEERNGIYECDFSYPITGAHYEDIQIGCIVGVTHDESGDIQPFDIVSYSRPINGVVDFHCVHISYRLNYVSVTGSNINSLTDALTLLSNATPANPFTYNSNKNNSGYLGAANGIPHSVRSILGGIEGSILDAYGGEYEFNKFEVYLHSARGVERDFSIRYGVNMLDYKEDYDIQGTYSSCIPYWTDGTLTVVGDKVYSSGSTVTGRYECVPLDLSDKFESEPTQAQVEAAALAYMNTNNTFMPSQNIHVEFARLQDMGYNTFDGLLECNLCDTINVIFPDFNSSGQVKIVKIIWNVLQDRYESMELGALSVTLAEALGVTQGSGTQMPNLDDFVKKSGDIMTGTLAVSRGNGETFKAAFTDVDAKLANNGVSANTSMQGINIYDKNGLRTTSLQTFAYPNGTLATTLTLRNFNTDGSQVVSNGPYINVNKSGTFSYSVPNPSAFRSAISVSDIRSTTVSKSVTLSANAKSSVDLTYSLPSGATIMSVSLSQVPNPNWVYASITSHTTTKTSIAYCNTYTSSITGYFEVMVMYKV